MCPVAHALMRAAFTHSCERASVFPRDGHPKNRFSSIHELPQVSGEHPRRLTSTFTGEGNSSQFVAHALMRAAFTLV